MQVTPVATPNPLAPATAPQAVGTPQGENSPFAKMLSAHRPPARPDEKKQAVDKKHDARTPQGNAGGAEEAGATDTEPAKKPNPVARRGAAHVDLRERHAGKATTTDGKAEGLPTLPLKAQANGEPDAPDEPEMDPALTEFAAAALATPMSPPVTGPTSAATTGFAPIPPEPHAPATGDGDGAAVAIAIAGDASSRPSAVPAAPALQARGLAKDDPMPAGAEPTDFAEAMRQTAETLTPRADAGARVQRLTESFKLPEMHAAAQPGPLPVASSTESSSAVPAPSVNLSTPVTSPEFREALGVQVSVLAKDGIQRAELHLHPADMGPISVQIALDGTQARVDFGVDSSTTRQIIESGLPELAAALRDAGFTLSGGGVSQHSRDKSDGQSDLRGGPGAATSPEDKPQAAPRTSVRLPRGAVDLYA